MRNEHNTTHQEELMFGNNAIGEYGGGTNPGFGRMAPFFRNYNKTISDTRYRISMRKSSSGYEARDGGQYMFGDNTLHWRKELAWVTSHGSGGSTGGTPSFTFTNMSEHGGDPSDGARVFRGDSQQAGFAEDHLVGTSFPDGTSLAVGNYKVADHHGWGDAERERNSIWFIDEGPNPGYRSASPAYTYSLHWGWTSGYDEHGATTNLHYMPGIHHHGNVRRMYLSFGPIYHGGLGADGFARNNFWDIGLDSNISNHYKTQWFKDWRSKFQPGEKFRWKEDPTGEVYDVQKYNGQQGRIRHTAPKDMNRFDMGRGTYTQSLGMQNAIGQDVLGNWINTSPGTYLFGRGGRGTYTEFPITDQTDWDYWRWSGSMRADYDDRNGDFRFRTALLSPNYSTNFITDFTNSSDTNNMSWDPSGPLGPIPGGLELTINHSASGNFNTPSIPTGAVVTVDSLVATNVDGTLKNIEVGMILTSHSGKSSADDIYDGADLYNDENVPLLIWKIEPWSGRYLIHLCGYSRVAWFASDAHGYKKHNFF